MALITNIRHFLDAQGEVAELTSEAQELLSFLTDIVAAATRDYGSPITFADTQCRTLQNGKLCSGEIEVWVYDENNQIGWECLDCGEEGTISDWEGTFWDKRNFVYH